MHSNRSGIARGGSSGGGTSYYSPAGHVADNWEAASYAPDYSSPQAANAIFSSVGKGTSVLGTILDMQVFSLIPLNRHLCSEDASRASSKTLDLKITWEDRFQNLKQVASSAWDFTSASVLSFLANAADPYTYAYRMLTGQNFVSGRELISQKADPTNTAYQAGLLAGDLASILFGIGEMKAGAPIANAGLGLVGAGVAGSAALALPSGGSIIIPGAIGVGAGIAITGAGAIMTGAGLATAGQGLSYASGGPQNIHEAGKAGEDYVAEKTGLEKNSDKEPVPGKENKDRILDFVDKDTNTFIEVKNVKYQGLTQQIIDEINIANQHGGTLELWVRPGTKISAPLKKAEELGLVIIIDELFT